MSIYPTGRTHGISRVAMYGPIDRGSLIKNQSSALAGIPVPGETRTCTQITHIRFKLHRTRC